MMRYAEDPTIGLTCGAWDVGRIAECQGQERAHLPSVACHNLWFEQSDNDEECPLERSCERRAREVGQGLGFLRYLVPHKEGSFS